MIVGVPDIPGSTFLSFRTDANEYPHFRAWECPGGVIVDKVQVAGIEAGGVIWGKNLQRLAAPVHTTGAGGEHYFDFIGLTQTEFILDFTATPNIADLYEVILQPDLLTPALVKLRRIHSDADGALKVAPETTAYITVCNLSDSGPVRCRVHLWKDENGVWNFQSEAYKPDSGDWRAWQYHRGYFSGGLESLRVNCSTDTNVKFAEGSTFRLVGWTPDMVMR